MGECVPDYEHAEFSLYRYAPSVAAAAIFAVLFSITTLLHLFQMFKTRAWYLTALTIGGLMEVIGFSARGVSASETPGCWSVGPYTIASIFVLLPPALFAASIYMILGRIILLTDGETHAIIRRQWLTKIFVTGDVISFLLQGSGGGMMANGGSSFKLGENMIVVGLFVQLVFFGLFIIVAGVFHKRMKTVPTARSTDPLVRWESYLTTLYVSSGLILVRSLFRVVEYLQGNDGTLLRNEVYMYVFDALLMCAVMAWMNWYHPSEIGILLRGGRPRGNGMKLLNLRRS